MHAEVLPSAQALAVEILTDSGTESRDEVASATGLITPPKTHTPSHPSARLDEFLGFGKAGRTASQPTCLIPQFVRKGEGFGPSVALDEHCGKLLVVTLGITDVVERTALTVSLWGSVDQLNWGDKPLLTFRQRQYCGVYSVLLNLATHTDIRYLRVHWSMGRVGRGERTPAFGFEVFAEESGARVRSAALA